jgi:hypothetical protein
MALYGGVSFAHHSHAMFDRNVDKVLTGTVQEFDFVNPHAYVQLISDQDKQNWTLELPAGPGLLNRFGWHKHVLQSGEKITAHLRPLRNGAPGGELMYLVKADGTKLVAMPEGSNISGAPLTGATNKQ